MSNSSHYKPSEEVKTNLTDTKVANIITIHPNALAVTWGRDSRYWDISGKNDESSIKLNQVSWLEVTGSFSTESLSGGRYSVKFTVSLKTNAFGWQGSPVYFLLLNTKTKKRTWRKKDLSSLKKGGDPEDVPLDLFFELPEDKNEHPLMNFGLYEIWKGGWKGGLEIHRVVVQKV